MKLASVLFAVGCWLSAASALQPGFDAREVVRQMRSVARPPSGVEWPELDDGEFLIDTSVTPAPAMGDQCAPAVAFDGANFLIVWQDERNGGRHIYGARVAPEGTVLDPAGITISQAAYEQSSPAVGFDGANFLVVWACGHGATAGICGARVTPQGTVLDTGDISISLAGDREDTPAVGFDGANFLVVWHDGRSGSDNDIYGARVTRQGMVLDSAGFVVSHAAGNQHHPALGFDGTDFLVVWEDYRNNPDTADVFGARVTPQGTVLDTAGVVISQATNYQWDPALAFDGVNFLVTWDDKRSGSWDIYGARVTRQGTVLEPAGIVISHAAGGRYLTGLDFDGANFLVAWEDGRNVNCDDIYGARVTPQGTVLDTAGIHISHGTYLGNFETFPVVGFNGANFLVLWQDSRSGDWDVYGKRVSPQGTVLDSVSIAISTAANWQWSPALASDGTDFLVVWQDRRSETNWDIYGARVTPQGTVLDPAGFVISQAADDQHCPALGFDGANFLVVWGDGRNGTDRNIHGARVTPQGTVLEPGGFVISQAAGYQDCPAVGFDGANFLVVWQDGSNGTDLDIYGARVTPQGTVLDPAGFHISHAANGQESPAVGAAGANFVVAWEDYRSDEYGDIYGARVTPQGIVLDSAGIAISEAAYDQGSPALASDGTDFLVAWQDRRSETNWDIYGARVTPQGTVLDPTGFVISQAASDQDYAAVSFDGTNFLAVWQDRRSGSDWDIYGARVTPGGVVFDGGSVVRQEEYQFYPRLALGTGNQMFLVYQGWAGTVGGKGYSSYRIWGKMDPSPAIADMTEPEVRMTNSGATIVRGVLFLNGDCPRTGTVPKTALLDAAGRKVVELHPGANDVSRLAPGVYFVREAVSGKRSAVSVRRVVITE
ncbi:MAG: hypothetical protein NTX53_21300 [candidate division WOR-3 bacterium]|nr:hypothetical protein [candidate division WOR-3 bacterium]